MRSPRSSTVLLLAALLAATPHAAAAQAAPTVVLLVRHGEKVSEEADPPLTEAGRERARALAALVRDAGLDRVLSTDYQRTRDTAAPAAAAAGVEVELYDGGRLAELAAELKASPGRRVLVVGHSNTTLDLVRLLGGEPGNPMDAEEYDRLYVLTLDPGGTTSTLLLRYGRPFRR